MAGGSLDNLSLMLGAMQSDIKEGIRQRHSMEGKLDQLMEVIPIVAEIRKEIDVEILPAVREWNASKHRAAGLTIGIGAGAGIGGAGLWPVVKAMFVRAFS